MHKTAFAHLQPKQTLVKYMKTNRKPKEKNTFSEKVCGEQCHSCKANITLSFKKLQIFQLDYFNKIMAMTIQTLINLDMNSCTERRYKH